LTAPIRAGRRLERGDAGDGIGRSRRFKARIRRRWSRKFRRRPPRASNGLKDWIALPSIAAEHRNYRQGPQYLAQLAEHAGFSDLKVVLIESDNPKVQGLDAAVASFVEYSYAIA
jgi:hypothetical protein